MPNCKTIAICNQKGGVAILHELNPEEMEGAFQRHPPSAAKRKRRNHKGYTVSENLLT